MTRQCGTCQACCKLLPVREIGKAANQRCTHQKFGKGCAIYDRAPASCRLWSCRWLVDETTGDLSRPDRSGYVIDMMPDFITIETPDGNERADVIQIWCDPKRPTAHRDPALRAWLEEQGKLALVRFNSKDAIILFPPGSTGDPGWVEYDQCQCGPQHSAADVIIGGLNEHACR